MTAKFRSKQASSLPLNSGPVPAKLAWDRPFFMLALFEIRKSLPYRDRWANVLQTAFCTALRNAAFPSIVVAPERSDVNDDLIAIGADTLAARIVPFIASTQPAVTVEERGGSGRIINPS